ncbi:Ran GTPase-activating protein (RanGAP) involved in mRNA processing and transport [Variovorax sp. PBS-H4]|uniref:hypothetical protein n=1 Tax=Variovorax sp. PBS-H4 TaxID=434008 RepID=UPI0013195F3D|nr:hypothetical protein [Variovorax sp. PBS-H4]VTU20934.1 Ran GTPase-activating protein (RanGAP) involved in mRNA processing and transport [Variovorax sp. PBS-H4]
MNFLGTSLNRFALARAVPTNVADPARTSLSKTRELRDAFDELVRDYDSKGQLPDPSRLVCECMRHRELGVLRDALAFFKEMRDLHIQGPMDDKGWETLGDAIPNGFSLEVLTLSDLVIDRFTVEQCFHALGKMPALANLSLHRVGAEAGVMNASECPALNQLKALSVIEAGLFEPNYTPENKISVSDLLIKLLGNCQVQNLSIEGLRFESFEMEEWLKGGPVVTFDQHASLGEVLCRQSELQVLRINRCFAWSKDEKDLAQNAALHLVRKIPVYKMPSLRLLDLSGSRLRDGTLAWILNALGQSGTCLRHLNLRGNFIGDSTVDAMAFLLMNNRTLRSLSFQDAKAPELHWSSPEHFINQKKLKKLTDALEHNTSLCRLGFEAAPNLDRRALLACLERNREAFKVSALRAMLTSSVHRLPNDLTDYFANEGARYLAVRDALTLSSLNQGAWDASWDASQRFLQGDGAST